MEDVIWKKPALAVESANAWHTLYMRASQVHDAMMRQMSADERLLGDEQFQEMRGAVAELTNRAGRETALL
jgi:hypothetical protein